MTRQKKNKFRAIFLLMVFSLNTIVGFACSLGVDMGYNTKHHSHESHSHNKPHVHKDGHKHQHTHKIVLGTKLKSTSDDCCSNNVTSFAQLEKVVAYNNLLPQVPFIILDTHNTTLLLSLEEVELAVNSRFQAVRRSCFLNDTDLQTAIRRFQI